MDNRFVFYAFWQHYNGMTGHEDWSKRFYNSNRQFINAFKKRDTVRVLSNVFDRLYVLRNQLVHGGSTWNSDINRDQVRDGAAHSRIPGSRLRRRHDGQSARGLGTTVLSCRAVVAKFPDLLRPVPDRTNRAGQVAATLEGSSVTTSEIDV